MATTAFSKKTLNLETIEPALTPPPANNTQANFAKKNKIGASGLREAKSKYDWAQIGQQLENLYQRAEENCARRK